MKKARILILFILSIVFADGITAELSYSGQNKYWSEAKKLWEEYSKCPTRENCERFYDFISKAPVDEQKEDLSWFVYDYRFIVEICFSNKYIALAGLRMSQIAEEKQANQIYKIIGGLCRVNPPLFLEVLAEAYNFLGDRITNVVISLPEVHDYLFELALSNEKYSSLLSFFSCYEYKRRYWAIEKVKGKKINKVRKACLNELSKKIAQMNRCQDLTASDDEFIQKLNLLWNLSDDEKFEIFRIPLDRDSIIYRKGNRNYPSHILPLLLEYEVFAGNYKALGYMTFNAEIIIISFKENTVWELMRVNPDMFLKYVKSYGDKKELINPFKSYNLIDGAPLENIVELAYRLEALSKVKERKYKEIKEKYINVIRDLLAEQTRRLVNEGRLKPSRGGYPD